MHGFYATFPPSTLMVLLLCFLIGCIITLTWYVIKAHVDLEMLQVSHESHIRLLYILRKDLGRLDSDLAQLSARVRYNTPASYVGAGNAPFGGGGGGGWSGGGNAGSASYPETAGGARCGGVVVADENQPVKIVGKEPR